MEKINRMCPYFNKWKKNRSGGFWVYILNCKDGTFYTGATNNLGARLKRHNDGLASKYTRARLPVKFVWTKEYREFESALRTEIMIKRLTRLQKESLVKGKRLDKVFADARIYERNKQKK